MSEGTEIKAFVYSFTGIMIFDSIVFDSPYNGMIVIEFSEHHQVIQRRKYLRMPFITDFYIIREEEGNIKTSTVDISGGGIRFTCETPVEPDRLYPAQLRLSAAQHLIKLEGVILKKNFYRANEYVMEYTEIEEKDRDKIIQKCLELERIQNARSNF